MTEVSLKCTCGAFRAAVHGAGPRHGTRVVCYCRSCQDFAHFLGRGEQILDENGGTDIYQVSPGRLEILQGAEHLAGVHLTEKPTLRWYTQCCRSPLGNTLNTNKLPFIGLIHTAIDTSQVDGGLDALIGPVRARVNGDGAHGDTGNLKIHKSAPISIYWRFIKMVLRTKLNGEHKKSPLFNHETGRPIVKPSRSSLRETGMTRFR